jgi:HAD superfamily hydrolase (TIGR01509 family)
VFFDLYGTLLIYGDTAAAWTDWLAALHASLEEMGCSIPRQALSSQCDGFFERPAPPVQDGELTIYERRIRELCVSLGLDPEHADLNKAAIATIRAWQVHVSLDPEAIPVLEALHTHKSLALVSNYDHPPYIHALLAELGLERFFDAVVVSGEVGVKKPDPRIFSPALSQTGLRPDQAIYVGDSPEDVAGALAAGLHPILIRRDGADSSQAGADFRSNQASAPGALETATCEKVRTITRLVELVQVLS